MTPTNLPSQTALTIDQEVRAGISHNHGPQNHTDFLNHSNNSKAGQEKNDTGKSTGRENIKRMSDSWTDFVEMPQGGEVEQFP